MKKVYSKYWITAREKIYGFLQYDKNLCDHVCKNVKKRSRLLEVGVGTGYPFGDFFQKKGYSVYGVDISPELIEKCKQLNPNIICKVGDAEDLHYKDDYFNCVYCFHSTWYFPDLKKAIDEMLRVIIPGGLVIFDIQNRNNKEIDNNYKKRLSDNTLIKRMRQHFHNIIKIVLGRSDQIIHPVVDDVPTYPEEIYRHLESIGVSDFSVMVRKKDESIEKMRGHDSFSDFERLIFAVRGQLR